MIECGVVRIEEENLALVQQTKKEVFCQKQTTIQ